MFRKARSYQLHVRRGHYEWQTIRARRLTMLQSAKRLTVIVLWQSSQIVRIGCNRDDDDGAAHEWHIIKCNPEEAKQRTCIYSLLNNYIQFAGMDDGREKLVQMHF